MLLFTAIQLVATRGQSLPKRRQYFNDIYESVKTISGNRCTVKKITAVTLCKEITMRYSLVLTFVPQQ